jgi:hypothetical protein
MGGFRVFIPLKKQLKLNEALDGAKWFVNFLYFTSYNYYTKNLRRFQILIAAAHTKKNGNPRGDYRIRSTFR